MKIKSKSLHNRLIRHLREWHRKLGIIAAFFLIFLSVSGIALNHTDWLGLSHKPIKSTWLLNHYGIKSPTDIRFFPLKNSDDLPTNKQKLVLTDRFIWLGEKLLLESDEPVVSMGQFQQLLFVTTKQNFYLYTLQGELIDRLDSAAGLPEPIQAVALKPNNLFIKTEHGIFKTDQDFFDWQATKPNADQQWLKASPSSEQEIAQATLQYQAQFLTLERIILDAHSGRFFGFFGVLFMDFIGLLLILLSLSGIYIWIRYARSKR